MRIDAHQHFWKYDPVNYAWINDTMFRIQVDFMPEHLEPLLSSAGFDGCVLVQVNQTEEETVYFHQLAEQYDFIKGVVGWTDLRAADLNEKLTKFSKLPFLKGFRHIVQGEPVGFMKDPAFTDGLKKLLPYDFTYDILIYPTQLKDALHVLRTCPDNRFVIDHLAKPYIREGKITQWANYMKEIAAFPNVCCKVSGMVTEADWYKWKTDDFYIYLDTVFESFGPERLMYGSDWPVCLVAASYEEQLNIVQSYFSRLSNNERDLIFGENAVRFYKL